MKKHGIDRSLRVLAIQSYLTLSIAVVVPLVAMFEGKRSEVISIFPFLFAGLIGIAAHQSITKVMKRIDELECRTSEIRKPE
jgi:hypothetical protein